MTLNDLQAEHPFYCSDKNYFDNSVTETYETSIEFLKEYEHKDPDIYLCIRFDVKDSEDHSGKCAYVFILNQRKGLFIPIIINSIKETEVAKFSKYLKSHWKKQVDNWMPFSLLDNKAVTEE
jgi:hypothetical protein